MITKQKALAKIAAAEKACNKVHVSWAGAAKALGGSVSQNGYGIFQGSSALRQKLLSAQEHIKTALQELAEIDWPTESDYDQL